LFGLSKYLHFLFVHKSQVFRDICASQCLKQRWYTWLCDKDEMTQAYLSENEWFTRSELITKNTRKLKFHPRAVHLE
jgi:hypothetical protein